MNSFGITIANLQLSTPISGDSAVVGNRIQGLPEGVSEYVQAALAENTRKAYRGDLQDFMAWGGCIPCTPELLAQYIAARAEAHCPQTITRRVVGISRAHTSQGLPDPAKNDLVRTVLRGVRRAHGTAQRQATPILREDLLAMLPHMQGTKGLRDRALLLIGFAGAFRRSELVALDVEDMAFVSEGLIVYLRKSKTDQEAEGRKIGIPWGRTAACPVKALRAWLDQAHLESGPAFPSVNKAGAITRQRITAQAVNLVVKRYAQAIGINPDTVSGHSLRAGLATSAAKAGIPTLKIMAQTGHRSEAMLARYVRDADLFTNNAAGVL